MPKYGVFSGPYFSVFSPNTGKYGPEKNYVFGHFSHSEYVGNERYYYTAQRTSVTELFTSYSLDFAFHHSFFFLIKFEIFWLKSVILNFRRLTSAVDGIFWVIPHDVRKTSGPNFIFSNLFRVLMDFGITLLVYRCNL